jgi:hypothetical protein
VQVAVRKGDTIGGFLKAVREQLAPQFRELRAVSADNMMYIKVRHSRHSRHHLVERVWLGRCGGTDSKLSALGHSVGFSCPWHMKLHD